MASFCKTRADITDMKVSFAESIRGGSREVNLDMRVACETCSASGAAKGSGTKSCDGCGGRGEVRTVRQWLVRTVPLYARPPSLRR